MGRFVTFGEIMFRFNPEGYLSRWRERGPDGLVTINREQRSRGVRACKNRKPPTLKYLFSRPIVPLL